MRRAFASMSVLVALSSCTSPSPSAPIVLRHPPADPGGPPPETQATSVYAIRVFHLGEVDPATGQRDFDAWRRIGFDIDEKATTKDSTDVCGLAPNAGRLAQTDGEGGIDNSFGSNVMPTIATWYDDFEGRVNASISAGLVTNLVIVRGASSGRTFSPASAALVVAAPLGAVPSWRGSDTWPIERANRSSRAKGPIAGPPCDSAACWWRLTRSTS